MSCVRMFIALFPERAVYICGKKGDASVGMHRLVWGFLFVG